jgi:hypothetical protein
MTRRASALRTPGRQVACLSEIQPGPGLWARSGFSLPEATDISGISNSELDVLFSTPDVYVRDIDWGTLDAVCVRMSRDTYSASTFLDQRTVSVDGEELRTPVVSLMDAYNADPPTRRPIMFIAHTALCGSTLLSRCLDIPGVCLPYKEPYLLHNLSGIWRLGLQKKLHEKVGRVRPHILDLALALVARSYGESEKPVVKLSDTCTSLLPSILARNPGSKVLLLYHELRRFLVAMLRYPNRRQYARNMQIRAEVDLRVVGRKDLLADLELSDARCVALVWMGLMYPYMRLLAAAPNRIRSLNATAFFTEPERTLDRLDQFFGLDIGPDRIGQRLAEGVLSRHSKNDDGDFDSGRYQADLESAETALRDEIDDAVAWVESVTEAEPIPTDLPTPL